MSAPMLSDAYKSSVALLISLRMLHYLARFAEIDLEFHTGIVG